MSGVGAAREWQPFAGLAGIYHVVHNIDEMFRLHKYSMELDQSFQIVFGFLTRCVAHKILESVTSDRLEFISLQFHELINFIVVVSY